MALLRVGRSIIRVDAYSLLSMCAGSVGREERQRRRSEIAFPGSTRLQIEYKNLSIDTLAINTNLPF